MRYQGGKERIAKPLAEVLIAAGEGRSTYIEPFLGGASVFARVAPHFERAIGADVVPDVALLWGAAACGWEPPESLTLEEWRVLRGSEPSALRAFAGFGCSFGGRFFEGYARDGTNRNFAASAARSIRRKASGISHAEFRHGDYSELTAVIDAGALVYCDPPYAGTKPYSRTPAWDSSAFWQTAEGWARTGAAVFVSEYTAPDGWETIWAREKHVHLKGGASFTTATERLFVWGGGSR